MTQNGASILIVDDEPQTVSGFEFTLESAGLPQTVGCSSGEGALRFLEEHTTDVVLLDLTMPGISGLEVLKRIHERQPDLPVIIITGTNEVDTAVECMKSGAFDYMVKPVDENRLVTAVRRALEMRELRREYATFKERVLSGRLERPEAFSRIVTRSAKMRSVFQYMEAIASSPRPVLITGESGVGKELVAESLHELSGLKGKYLVVNVAGLDDNMFSDTLFGHVKGAFTGADRHRDGLIKTAEGGTLFLDEIGDLSLASQVKLLRLLQERRYYPLGSDIPKDANVRILVATNRDLAELVAKGQFRADLFYRLQTHHLHIPPLRERLEDIPPLVSHFIEMASQHLKKRAPTVPRELYAHLASYTFPGNIRELEGMVYDAVTNHRSHVLSLERFKIIMDRAEEPPMRELQEERPFATMARLPSLKEAQQLIIEEALRRSEGSQTVAARLLGMTQSGLSKALKRNRSPE